MNKFSVLLFLVWFVFANTVCLNADESSLPLRYVYPTVEAPGVSNSTLTQCLIDVESFSKSQGVSNVGRFNISLNSLSSVGPLVATFENLEVARSRHNGGDGLSGYFAVIRNQPISAISSVSLPGVVNLLGLYLSSHKQFQITFYSNDGFVYFFTETELKLLVNKNYLGKFRITSDGRLVVSDTENFYVFINFLVNNIERVELNFKDATAGGSYGIDNLSFGICPHFFELYESHQPYTAYGPIASSLGVTEAPEPHDGCTYYTENFDDVDSAVTYNSPIGAKFINIDLKDTISPDGKSSDGKHLLVSCGTSTVVDFDGTVDYFGVKIHPDEWMLIQVFGPRGGLIHSMRYGGFMKLLTPQLGFNTQMDKEFAFISFFMPEMKSVKLSLECSSVFGGSGPRSSMQIDNFASRHCDVPEVGELVPIPIVSSESDQEAIPTTVPDHVAVAIAADE